MRQRIDPDELPAVVMVSAALLLVAVIALLSGCQHGQVVEPTPPLVTPCVAEPAERVPDEPARPQRLTDGYVVLLHGWANDLLGVITADRIAWRGERRCIRQLQAKGHVR